MVKTVVLVTNEISDAADSSPIDIRDQFHLSNAIQFVQTACRFANDQKLTFDCTSNKDVVLDLLDAASVLNPTLDELDGRYDIRKTCGQPIRMHPSALAR